MYELYELHDQEDSLAESLKKAGMRHGDTAEVTMDVGVKSYGDHSQLCFCSIKDITIESIRYGSMEEQVQPMPANVRFSRKSRAVFQRRLNGKHGAASIRCTIVTNGAIYINNLRVKKMQKKSRCAIVDRPGSLLLPCPERPASHPFCPINRALLSMMV